MSRSRHGDRVKRERRSLSRFVLLAIGAALVTMALKAGAYWVTGSVALLSDALESTVNLTAAMVALFALRLAGKPPDDSHHFGHGKAEYFSALIEGIMILAAAGAVIASAVPRFLQPRPLEQVGAGLAVTAIAALINLAVAVVLVRAGRRHRSITLLADGRHLLTDVWTSGGVLLGVALVSFTGVEWLDPLVAVLVAVNIVVTGFNLIRRSTAGLMDAALPAEDLAAIEAVLDRYRGDRVDFHALRARAAGWHRFVSVHVLVPGHWTIQQGHNLVERIEADIAQTLPDATPTTHLEPRDDPASYDDIAIGPDRWQARAAASDRRDSGDTP